MKTAVILLIGVLLAPQLKAQRWSATLLDETVAGKSAEFTVPMDSGIVYRVERQVRATHSDWYAISITPRAGGQAPGLFRETATNDPDARLFLPRVSGPYRVRVAAPAGGTLRVRILIDSVDNPQWRCVRENHGTCEAVERIA
jgi:hypothetical protein